MRQTVFSSERDSTTTPAFAWIILALMGCIDLVRGVLHTFFVKHSAVEIAGMDLSHSGGDQLMLLGSFGISNFLTGFLFLAVAFKARHLVPTVLFLTPLANLLGFGALRLNHIHPESAFPGRTFLLGYMTVCLVTFVASVICMRKKSHANGILVPATAHE